MSEELAALRIQSIARGRRDRARVDRIRQDRSSTEDGGAEGGNGIGGGSTEEVPGAGGAGGGAGAGAGEGGRESEGEGKGEDGEDGEHKSAPAGPPPSLVAREDPDDEPLPAPAAPEAPELRNVFGSGRLSEEDIAVFRPELLNLVLYLTNRGVVRSGFWKVTITEVPSAEEEGEVVQRKSGAADPNAGPSRADWVALLDTTRIVARYNAENCTALHAAVIAGAAEAVEPLLAAGADPNIVLDGNNLSPLMSALLHGYEDVCLLGACVELRT